MKTQLIALPRARAEAAVHDFLWAIVGSLFIALCAQVSFSLPFTMVPTSFQAQAVLLTAWVLGPRRGLLAVMAYLAEGAFGLPVFAGFYSGTLHLFGPTGGYLLSYLPTAFLVGFASRFLPESRLYQASIFLAGYVLVLFGGFMWLTAFVGPAMAWTLGVAPFIVIGLLKIIMLVCILPVCGMLKGWIESDARV